MIWLGRLLYFLQSRRSEENPILLLRLLLTRVASMVIYTVTLGILAGALLVGLLFALYHFLLAQNIEPGGAFGVVIAIAALLAIAVVAKVKAAARALLDIPRQMQKRQHPVQSYLSSIVESFMDGFHEDKPKRTRKRK